MINHVIKSLCHIFFFAFPLYADVFYCSTNRECPDYVCHRKIVALKQTAQLRSNSDAALMKANHSKPCKHRCDLWLLCFSSPGV